MAGIYIHIPFCKQACNYCNFYFVTSVAKKEIFLTALLQEIELTQSDLQNEPIETIYFGGGTPSLLEEQDLNRIFEQLYKYHSIDLKECTFETNPDDLSPGKIKTLKQTPINRLSIGVQSFFDEDLRFMQRAHNANEAETAIRLSQENGFDNLTIDLIYGTPGLTMEKWLQNLSTANSFNIQHLSCYALTVEPKTKLHQQIKKELSLKPNDETASLQFDALMQFAQEHNYQHYEISNFAKPGHLAVHNTNYWKGKKYLGLGPSAHSFDGRSRRWNISNLNTYISSLAENKLPFTQEDLTEQEQTNEYIMTSLRTMWGCDIAKIPPAFRPAFDLSLLSINPAWYTRNNNTLILTPAGKHFADYIASELFII